jgi:hypothetical protein
MHQTCPSWETLLCLKPRPQRGMEGRKGEEERKGEGRLLEAQCLVSLVKQQDMKHTFNDVLFLEHLPMQEV